ncbi:SMP-30/gluconolactonase/LRE family protein [Aurantiacibacter suaedae]|uniref:SMP-30/gluconolactonase/LRE family protein n=1 Tax=Aurantiacibacter suaedae TaxID=2545755 RepID=UPI0010F4FD49|nr:SMP-30/gluconolactonase/LRE family protein [Aurantiacibacter suaedae]
MGDWQLIERRDRDLLGEGLCWSGRENALYWTDILAPAINRLDLQSLGVERCAMPEPVGWLVERKNGGLIAGLQSGIARIALDPLVIDPVADLEPHLPNNRMNDGKADSSGFIWCGTMDFDCEGEAGSLYRVAPDYSWSRIDSGYGVTNGPAFSPCGNWLYHTDTVRKIIYRFARTPEGARDREIFISFGPDDGAPDGMTVDSQGGLWVAHWGASRISRFNPDGRLEKSISLPAKQITNITFGGADLDRMFVTSAAQDLPDSRYDGALFEVDCGGAKGLPTGLFAG